MTLKSSASIEQPRLNEMFAPNAVAIIGASPDSHPSPRPIVMQGMSANGGVTLAWSPRRGPGAQRGRRGSADDVAPGVARGGNHGGQ